MVTCLSYLQVKTDGHQDLVCVVSGQEGHKHILQNNVEVKFSERKKVNVSGRAKNKMQGDRRQSSILNIHSTHHLLVYSLFIMVTVKRSFFCFVL